MVTLPADPGIVSGSLPGLGNAGNGLSGLVNSGNAEPATCLKPGFGSGRGVLGRGVLGCDGVPRKLSRLPFKFSIGGVLEEGLGTGSALSTEVYVSFRDNIPLMRSLALGAEGLGLSVVGCRARALSDMTVSSIVLGFPTFFRAENF